MPTALELKKVWEELDAQIAVAEQVEREAEEVQVATEKACLEQEERAREAEEVRVRAEEEA